MKTDSDRQVERLIAGARSPRPPRFFPSPHERLRLADRRAHPNRCPRLLPAGAAALALPLALAFSVGAAAGPAGADPITVTVDPGANRHPISPLIYGVNFGDDTQAARLRWPVRRWGGN